MRSGGCLRFFIAIALALIHPAGITADDRGDDDYEALQVVEPADEENWADPVGDLKDKLAGLMAHCTDETELQNTQDRLGAILRRKLAPLEWTCELTETQRKRLHLAGRGDVQRLVNRITVLHARGATLPKLITDETFCKLNDEADELQSLLDAGPFGDDSLLSKALQHTLTADQFARFEEVSQFEHREDWQVVAAADAPGIPGLRVSTDSLHDETLKLLLKFTFLRRLTLGGSEVCDDDLDHLQELTRLEFLDLSRSSVTDDGLWRLRFLTSLRILRLDNTLVSGEGFRHLQLLPNLEELSVVESSVMDDGLVHLPGLKKLQSVNLHNTLITDAGLAHLSSLPLLKRVNLENTDLTDSGLRHLRTIKTLELLDCSETNITPSGIAMLNRWRPGLIVNR
ncbi:MAG: hypothetical protein HY290_08885 [Planctomycetia bacterium]|nr:hypothetical protein [Planctomycetia bacterium]